jgi:hypothetical protein
MSLHSYLSSFQLKPIRHGRDEDDFVDGRWRLLGNVLLWTSMDGVQHLQMHLRGVYKGIDCFSVGVVVYFVYMGKSIQAPILHLKPMSTLISHVNLISVSFIDSRVEITFLAFTTFDFTERSSLQLSSNRHNSCKPS